MDRFGSHESSAAGDSAESGTLTALTRRGFLQVAGATSFGLLLAACAGSDSGEPAEGEAAEGTDASIRITSEERPLKDGLLEGMWGGPVGFPGDERYQYEFDSEEGRAIRGLRRMVQDGTAPETLIVQVLDAAEPHITEPIFEGTTSLAELFEQETGIKIETVTTTPESNLTDNLEAISSQDDSFDVVQTTATDIGDLAEQGLLRPLDDLVELFEPSWSDPLVGYVGGEPVVRRLNMFRDTFYVVAMNNGTQPFAYRADLFRNPDERTKFEETYNSPLLVPRTWEEHRSVAEFFTRKDDEPPLYGDVGLRSPIWQIATWQQRFVCSAVPNMHYFNEDGSANLRTEAGIRATEEHLQAAEWAGPDVLVDIWSDQFANFGGCKAVTGNSFPTITRVLPGNPDFDTENCGRFLAVELTPGRIIDGELVRRPLTFGGIAWGVNAFAEPTRQRAAYLFAQWAGGSRIHTWLVRHPAAAMNPLHANSFRDPAIIAIYSRAAINDRGETAAEVLRRITPFAAPPIRIRGAAEYTQALDIELQRTLAGQKTPIDAVQDAAAEWDRITEELGVEAQAQAIQAERAAWPTLTET